MDRTKFFNTVTVNETEELDYLHNNLSRLTLRYKPSRYRVNATDLMRPDLISYKIYGIVGYWWILMLVNGVQNPLEDLQVGQILIIPNQVDIHNFIKKYRMR